MSFRAPGTNQFDSVEISNTGSGTLVVGTALSDDRNFLVEPERDTIGPGQTALFYVHFIPTSAGPKDGKIIFYHNGLTSPDCFAVSGTGTWHTETLSYPGGWQLVSSPIIPGEYQTIPGLYSYRNGYRKEDTLKAGIGYWAKPETLLTISGFVQSIDSFKVEKGWNIIGSVNVPVARSAIVTIPDSLMLTDLFGFNGSGYVVSDTVYPGRAYWVKTSSAGIIVME